MKIESLHQLADKWDADANLFDFDNAMFGGVAKAHVYRECAAELREALQPCVTQEGITEQIYLLLAHASEGTVDPDRAMEIATRAVAEACDNREGK